MKSRVVILFYLLGLSCSSGLPRVPYRTISPPVLKETSFIQILSDSLGRQVWAVPEIGAGEIINDVTSILEKNGKIWVTRRAGFYGIYPLATKFIFMERKESALQNHND